MQQPLHGIRVLDLSAVLSGPMCTALLADQGAEVIKVEPPGGDLSRRIGPAKGDMSAMFIAANRGKRSIVLDLKRAEHLQVLHELARRADVLVENFRPGAMARLGLDHATLAAANPRLIYASITGFGAERPLCRRPGLRRGDPGGVGHERLAPQPGQRASRRCWPPRCATSSAR